VARPRSLRARPGCVRVAPAGRRASERWPVPGWSGPAARSPRAQGSPPPSPPNRFDRRPVRSGRPPRPARRRARRARTRARLPGRRSRFQLFAEPGDALHEIVALMAVELLPGREGPRIRAVHEEDAVEVVHLVLEGAGRQPLLHLLLLLALAVEIADPNREVARQAAPQV